MNKLVFAACAAAALVASPVWAQPAPVSSYVITVYRAAPGHQEQLLRWLARQDEITVAAGGSAAQLYVHQNGASWDYLIVAPQATPASDQAQEAAARRLGRTTGPRTGIELREHVAWHEDTIAAGPTTAAEWLRRVAR